jgi:hypothetical protein
MTCLGILLIGTWSISHKFQSVGSFLFLCLLEQVIVGSSKNIEGA